MDSRSVYYYTGELTSAPAQLSFSEIANGYLPFIQHINFLVSKSSVSTR